jgi:hypothetical protein
MEYALAAALGALFGALCGALAAWRQIAGSGPVATAKALADLDRVRLEWEGWRKGAEAVLEGMAELEEVIERKRTRIAARESKEKQRLEAANGSGDPKRALLDRARAQGHPV